MFVSDFYSYSRVKEVFGNLSKVKEECKVFSTDKGETFTLPFFLTTPSLLMIPYEEELGEDECTILKWKGKLPNNLPPSFIGLFCSFQYFARVKIVWKSPETGQIGFIQEEIVFKVINDPNISSSSMVLGILTDDIKAPAKDLDEIFPDDLDLDSVSIKNILEEIKIMKNLKTSSVEETIRSIVESDSGYNRSLSVEIDKETITLASIHLKRTRIHPGAQIFIILDLILIGRIELIKIGLECIESYSEEYLQPIINDKLWKDVVKEIKLIPGYQDRIEIAFPVPPDLPSSISCNFFEFQWELKMNFVVDSKEFDLYIPLQFYSINYEFNNKM